MCGIAGIYAPQASDLRASIGAMTDALVHRGPDDGQVLIESSVPLGLGHRRLSILDLSPLGRQPMTSHSGRYVIVFNGEVFNFRELRKRLEGDGETFNGGSDTEVMLAAIERFGVKRAAEMFVGMFAFAVWDRANRRLHLVRDRLGIKPLYYGWNNGRFMFASELKAFRADPNFSFTVNTSAVRAFLRYGYVPSPLCIYERCFKLAPGTILTLRESELTCLPSNFSPSPDSDAATRPSRYWDASKIVSAAAADRCTLSGAKLVDELESRLNDAVALRMVADVPVGAFLSGGTDSSLVVATMQRLSTRPVKTFSIGFEDEAFDESRYAARVAKHLGTEHHELIVSMREPLEVIPKIPEMYDEPFGDSSQIPTFLVSKLASQHVKVALSGDGGDELFCGYGRYARTQQLWSAINLLPCGARQVASDLVTRCGSLWSGQVGNFISKLLPKGELTQHISDKCHSLAHYLNARSFDDLYDRAVSTWQQEDFDDWTEGTIDKRISTASRPFSSVLEQMMFTDLLTYLPDDILVKVDRASMAVGLEARVPLLDHRLVEFVWSIPIEQKRRGNVAKAILKDVLARYVPREMVDRPKMGFGIPINKWLRGPLRDWGSDLIARSHLEAFGFYDADTLKQQWMELQRNEHTAAADLWVVLMLLAWLERWG